MRAFLFRVPSPFATSVGARNAAVRYVAAIATALGLPRDPTEAELTRIGPASLALPLSEIPRRRWWARPRRIDAGPLSGSWVIVLDVAHPAIAALDGRTLPVPSTYDGRSVPGAATNPTVTINLSAGVAISGDHDGEEEEP